MRETVEALDLSDIDRQPVRAAITPFASLLISVLDALDDPIAARRAPWRDDIRNRLRQRDIAALLPLGGSGWHPECGVPAPDAPVASMDDELDRIQSVPIEDIEAELDDLREGPAKARWVLARRGSARWKAAYVDALARAWVGYQPVWDKARTALDREVERLGAGIATGAVRELLATVHPRSHVVGERWHLQSDISRELHVSCRGLRLAPMIHPTPRVCLHDDDHDGLCALGYPLPGFDIHRALDAVSPNALAALLGAPRSMFLRRLDQPMTVGSLADALHAVPSAATHHVRALERAGLVRRERAGQKVLVSRTRRGTALLELYSS